MLDTPDVPLPITLPISESDRHHAYDFANQQPNHPKAEQVYRNTLAVLATQNYLQLLGIETTPETSRCWHPLHRVLDNVADLVIPAFADPSDAPAHHLDCRSVQAGDRTCVIPESVWTPDPKIEPLQLMGHVIVQLDKPYHTAHILGFTPPVSTSVFPLTQLQPLANLVDAFLAPIPYPESEPEPIVAGIPLHQWLTGKVTQDWQTLTQDLAEQWSILQGSALIPAMGMRSVAAPIPDPIRRRIEDLYCQELAKPKSPEDYTDALIHLIQTTQSDETRWQAAELLWSLDPQHPQSPVITLKDLGIYLNQQTVALMVGLLAKADGSFLMLARVCPMADTTVLPTGLVLMGCDEQNEPIFKVEARQRDQYIQFKFTAERGDRFSLQVRFNHSQFTESFVV